MGMVQFPVDQQAAASAAQGGGGGKTPPGRYVLAVESFVWDAPKTTEQSARLITKSKITQSFNNMNLNRVRTRRLSLSPKAIPYFLIPFLKAAGIPYQYQGGQIAFDDAHLYGATTSVECSHGLGQDKVTLYEEWGNDEPVGQAQQQPAPPQQPNPFQQPAVQQHAQPPPQAQPSPFGAPPQAQAPFPPQQAAPAAAPWTPPGPQQGAPPAQHAPPAQQQFAPPPNGAQTPPWAQQAPAPGGPPGGQPFQGGAPAMPPRGHGQG